MATVTGVLSDISDIPLSANPEIVFYPSSPATNAASYNVGGTTRAAGGSLFGTKEVRVTPTTTGFFTATLHPSTNLLAFGDTPATYTVRIEWNEPSGNRTGQDIITGLVVTGAGGTIGALIDGSPGAQLVWVSTSAPKNPRKGTRWLYTGTTNTTYTNSHLYEWR